ncbi:hypothetical protein ABZ791_02070 [Streptomyces huasconensis]|uniref:Uncharacterized protein n=1 Tax=Streptomyces huasconensis TaxID=1854574 RepID=A0ABV3LRL9_9ACTN
MPQQETTALVVPVRLDALSVSRKQVTHDLWHRGTLSFGDDYQDPQPAPMDHTTLDAKRAAGVYLHWHLAEALGRGRAPADDTKKVTFPAAPNRWLVVRYHHPDRRGSAELPDVTGWLVHSDYVADKRQSAQHPEGATSPVGRKRWMGRSIDLATSEWNEPSDTGVRLTVAEAGVATFATFQPYCRNIFSLHDPLGAADDAGTLAKGFLSYTAIGWHSRPGDDVLHTEQLQALLDFYGELPAGTGPAALAAHLPAVEERLGWALPSVDLSSGEQRSVYQGAVYALPWDPEPTTVPRGNRPHTPKDSVKVAVGHGTADALGALVADSLPADITDEERRRIAALARAFHSGQLAAGDTAMDAPTTLALLADAAHGEWFTPTDGGLVWQLTDERPAGKDPMPPEVFERLRQAVARLNVKQHALDQAGGELGAARRLVWDLWWLLGWYEQLDVNERPKDFDADKLKKQLKDGGAPPTAAKRLETAQSNVTALGAECDRLAAAVRTQLPTGWSLVAAPREPLYGAGDPAVVLRGIGIPLRDSSGKQPPLRRETRLLPRPTAKVIGEASVQAMLPQAAAAAASAPDLEVKGSAARFPAKFSSVTAALKPSGLAGVVEQLVRELHVLHAVTHYYRTKKNITDGTALSGLKKQGLRLGGGQELPAESAFWQQPWQPLTLAWRVRCHPLPYELPDKPGELLWSYDGGTRTLRRHEDVRKELAAREKYGFEVQGRSLLAPLPVYSLRERIKSYLSTYRDTTGFADFRGKVGDWDLYGQTLTGLRDALAGRQPRQVRGVPPLRQPPETAHTAWADTDPKRPLRAPVQAAQVAFRDLVVVDTFGQALRLVHSTGEEPNDASFRPRVSPGTAVTEGYTVTSSDWQRLWQLPPRLPQPSRLNLTLLSHRSRPGADREIDPFADPRLTADTPVCGWLVTRGYGAGDSGDPSRNCRLTVHDPVGVPLGEVLRIGPHDKSERHAVGWRPLPDSGLFGPAEVHGAAFAAEHPQLAGFLTELVDKNADDIAAGKSTAGSRPKRFADLCKTVDNGLLATGGRPAGQGVSAALAAGRALALVRLRVHLELDGPLLTDPRWDHVLKRAEEIDPCLNRRWPVRLGVGRDRADGLIGYFTGAGTTTSYTTLHTDHGPSAPKSDYCRAIGSGAGVAVPARPRAVAVAPGDAAYVTLLMDPFLALHAHTGLLPVTRVAVPNAGAAHLLEQAPLAVPLGPGLARVISSADLLSADSPVLPLDRLTLPAPTAAGRWSFAAMARDVSVTGPWDHYALSSDATAAQLEPHAPHAHTGFLIRRPDHPAP